MNFGRGCASISERSAAESRDLDLDTPRENRRHCHDDSGQHAPHAQLTSNVKYPRLPGDHRGPR